MALVLLSAAAAGDSGVRSRFEAAVREKESLHHSVQGRVRVETRNERGGEVEVLEGRFWVKRPAKMAVIYDPPSPQSVVSDGKTTWFYQPEVNQVTISRGGATPLFVDLQAGFKGLLSRGEILKVEETEGGFLLLVRKGGLKLKVRVDGRTLLPLEVESRQGGTRTLVRFSELNLDPEIPEERFQFRIPEGAEVMNMDEGADSGER